jgi:putative SOS response-associated peptidase YedK
MCGRYTLRAQLNRLLQIFAAEGAVDWRPRYNIAPSQSVLVIRSKGRDLQRELLALQWGLIPSWATDPAIGNRMINARAETLAEKPAFRQALAHRRCLVLADGFYEWKLQGKTRQPYFIQMADERPFAFAGLWDCWNKATPAIESCTIITTSPNELLAGIHDRMPVILTEDAIARWLDPAVQTTDALTSLLVPYAAEEMKAHAVDTLVNSPQNDTPGCIEPPRNRQKRLDL